MALDRAKFYDHVRSSVFGGHMTPSQVDGVNTIIDGFGAGDPRWLAYILATAFHETAKTMRPIAEIGKGRGRPYGVKIDGKVYYGRGYVQLTWIGNYRDMSKVVDENLVADPDLALVPSIAAKIMFYGMEHGSFTGKKLADYINDKDCDFVDARRIINGLDHAAQIGVYAHNFNEALS